MWSNIISLITFLSSVSADDYDTCRRDCINDDKCTYATFEHGDCIHIPLGTVMSNPAMSCLHAFENGQTKSGLYWIQTPSGVVQTSCDMDDGGWTLVGEVGGTVEDRYLTWLRDNHNVEQLSDTKIQSGSYSCLDAVNIAVNLATQIRLSNSGNNLNMGPKWVEWDLPAQRDLETFWNLETVTPSMSSPASTSETNVRDWMGQSSVCWQNKYGTQTNQAHGGSYPCTSGYASGSLIANDRCMSVNVMSIGGSSYNGWTHGGGNGRDCPKDDGDWLNANYGQNCFLAVWLK